jgi:hypothetical protein
MEAERLARLSNHCDKYDYIRALGPWAATWLRSVKSEDDATEALEFADTGSLQVRRLDRFQEKTTNGILKLIPMFIAAWE